MPIESHTLDTEGATIAYDVRPAATPSGHRPLVMIGQPMTAEGFTTLASHFTDRVVVTYDQRGLGRSTRTDGHQRQVPATSVDDLHRLVTSLGLGPVDVFASSGGAVNALAWVAAHPGDVATLVAHEPPILGVLPDAAAARAAERAVQDRYRADGWGAGMAAFIGLTSWQGEFTDAYLAAPPPDPAAFGMPTEDDGSRDDPLLSGVANDVTAFDLDADAVSAAPTRVVPAAGIESKGTLTWRTSEAVAAALGEELVVFPSHHGGFLGGEFGQAGEPEAFAARLHEVLDS
ncbi:alpha/beta fold hydrolase [Nocardioides euryhalodurans]|uniref:Alpha/beta hydrolase n=1 Tax=Nocardioides euryhalodurans TaxID=2518370 RepID=A0A4P7GJW6_9ACTN|nr:alpha/beta hydrolase [Nocardioides euryhalodurans]QBR92057.1 alpha/beta hydrolase [Nocardioides euryhalodurans]